MPKKKFTIPLFYPYVTTQMKQAAYDALGEKIITQGQNVDTFEKRLNRTLGTKNLLTVNSCTSALELAYHLLNLKPGDEVITPVFTCTATNIPLLRRGVNIVFADVKDTLLMDWNDVAKKVTKKTKAIIDAHLFGQLNETRNFGVPVVGDAAQYLGKTSGERFTAYSFQATKILTTVDGGALVCQRPSDYRKAKLLRWYGINRETSGDTIDVDITIPGYKYHMNDVAAAIGIAGLKTLKALRKNRMILQNRYKELLGGIGGYPYLIHVPNRERIMTKLAALGIETGLGHRRNDLYSLFGGKRQHLPTMNRLEHTYLLLPCHNHMTVQDVEFVSNAVKKNI